MRQAQQRTRECSGQARPPQDRDVSCFHKPGNYDQGGGNHVYGQTTGRNFPNRNHSWEIDVPKLAQKLLAFRQREMNVTKVVGKLDHGQGTRRNHYDFQQVFRSRAFGALQYRNEHRKEQEELYELPQAQHSNQEAAAVKQLNQNAPADKKQYYLRVRFSLAFSQVPKEENGENAVGHHVAQTPNQGGIPSHPTNGAVAGADQDQDGNGGGDVLESNCGYQEQFRSHPHLPRT